MTHSKHTTAFSGNGGQYSSRNGVKITHIILHHCAGTSLFAVLDMMKYGTRTVSANYVIGNEGQVVSVVPEEYRAWTSSSASWDGKSITFEIVNESAGGAWPISAKAFDATARVMADIADRYGISLSRSTVVTHQELYTKHGTSYATACPGPYLQSRVDELIALAKSYQNKPANDSTTTVEEEDEEMAYELIVRADNGKDTEWMLVHPSIGPGLADGSSRTEKVEVYDKPGKTASVLVHAGTMVTTSADLGHAWGRMYRANHGNAPTARFPRDKYVPIQAAARLVGRDFHRRK